MATDNETRTLLNKQLLSAAQQGDVEELLTSAEYRDPKNELEFLFDINCKNAVGNTPLHLAVLDASLENVNHLIQADGCNVDIKNQAGDTPLHLAVLIENQEIRHKIVSALVEEGGAVESIQETNKRGQTPSDLAKIRHPRDTKVISLMTPPARQVANILGDDDIASDGEDGPGSSSE